MYRVGGSYGVGEKEWVGEEGLQSYLQNILHSPRIAYGLIYKIAALVHINMVKYT